MVSKKLLQSAQDIVQQQMRPTPLVYAQALSELSGAEVFLKLENLQITGSFKSRGSLVKLESLSAEEKAKGVVAASAGNHAQGVAYHAKRMGIPSTIVMPKGTPFNKISKTEKLGARVIVTGENFNQARDFAVSLIDSEGLTYISPFDDEHVIAGQGTVGLEMMEQTDKPFDVVFVPIGGGGLMGGLSAAMREFGGPCEIIGVQCDAYPSMYNDFYQKDEGTGQSTLAEGIAVKVPGDITKELIKKHVDSIDVVSETEIEKAVHFLLESQRLVSEGAGAVGVASFQKHMERFKGKRVGIVISGGNVDSRVLSSVLMRGLVRDARMIRLRIALPDQPGSLSKVSSLISESKANIVEIYHHRLFFDVPVKMTEVDIVVETMGEHHVPQVINHVKEAGYSCRRISLANVDGDV